MFNSCQTFPIYGRFILCAALNYKSDPPPNRNGWVDVPGHRIITRSLKFFEKCPVRKSDTTNWVAQRSLAGNKLRNRADDGRPELISPCRENPRK